LAWTRVIFAVVFTKVSKFAILPFNSNNTICETMSLVLTASLQFNWAESVVINLRCHLYHHNIRI